MGVDGAETAGLEVLERLDDLELGVHHERPVGDDRLPDRQGTPEKHAEGGTAALLPGVGGDGDRVTGTEHGQLTALDGATLGPDMTLAAEDVGQRVEVASPGQRDARPGTDGGVHQGDRGVRGAGTGMAPDLA